MRLNDSPRITEVQLNDLDIGPGLFQMSLSIAVPKSIDRIIIFDLIMSVA